MDVTLRRLLALCIWGLWICFGISGTLADDVKSAPSSKGKSASKSVEKLIGPASPKRATKPRQVGPGPVQPWQDDAALHAVQFVGTKYGWACGDHGVLWHSTDGGQTWSHLPTVTQASLRSLHFVTNQMGWLVGSGTQPFTGIGYGVLLKTTDGGRSWEEAETVLPPLYYVRFFGTEEGIAVGEANAQFPTGVLRTEDGGATWKPVEGQASAGWLAADFVEPDRGVIGGARGRLAVVADETVMAPRNQRTSLRTMRKIDMTDGLQGWAVGDGGLVLMTQNGGVSWQAPPQTLPEELGRFVDLRAVAARGQKVWISGSPGGCIWHSADAGSTWQQQRTGITSAVQAIHFSSDDVGWAVGAFGAILKTIDGGATWEVARAEQRRAAMLTVHARPERLPFAAFTKYAGEQGFRTVSLLLPRWDSTGERDRVGPFERRAQDAALSVGCNHLSLGWRLPMALPEVDRHVDSLTAEWQKHTEGRMVEIVVSNLVAEIRQWRPSVVVIDEPGADDAVGKIIVQAVQRAVIDAASADRFVEHRQLCGLAPWKVERVYRRLNGADSGRINVEPYEALPQLGTTVEQVATGARSMLFPSVKHVPQRESFRDDGESIDGKFQLASAREFWTGLNLAPGSEARRAQRPYDEQQAEQQREQAVQQRNFRGIVDKYLDDPQRASGLIAEMRGAVRNLPSSQAAVQLVQLADDYRRRSQWDLAEATMIEVVDFYRDEPVSAQAMTWLLQLWSSEEMAWQRGRKVSLTARRQTVDRAPHLARMQKLAETGVAGADDPLRLFREPTGDVVNLADIPSQDASQWRNATERAWLQQSVHLARVIRQRQPALFPMSQVQLPLASSLRRTGNGTMSDSVFRKLVQKGGDSPTNLLAQAELWMTQPADEAPIALGTCRIVPVRPTLDGILGDDCWRAAQELRMTSVEDSLAEFNGSYPFVLMTCDSEFLYLAGSFPSVADQPVTGPQYAGRKHDAVLTGFDRVAFELDVNRDYATSYRIEIDQRGHVAESCWEDASWNPKLFVAVAGDASHWRFEAAIPLHELVAKAPPPNTTWAVSVTRTKPLIGEESWPSAHKAAPQERVGLVQFR